MGSRLAVVGERLAQQEVAINVLQQLAKALQKSICRNQLVTASTSTSEFGL